MTVDGRPMLTGLIIAAGKGTRMKSRLPKVLHTVCGLPIVERVVLNLKDVKVNHLCVVLGGDLDQFSCFLKRYPESSVCVQKNRRGTGDAVASSAPAFKGASLPNYANGQCVQGGGIEDPYVLICFGDTPTLRSETLNTFVDECFKAKADLGVIGMDHPFPTGYGRLVMTSSQRLERIVEEKDADLETKGISICNTGVMFARTKFLFELLQELSPNNAQNEYYLTDCFALAHAKSRPALVFITKDYQSFDGVNDRSQLADAEVYALSLKQKKFMALGVTFHLPHTIYFDDTVSIGEDSSIGSSTSLLGQTTIGARCVIGSNVVLTNVKVSDDSIVLDGTIARDRAI